ncbi:hypothetical protein OIU76_028991 [Salix suchowensis]|uniref:Uncharacterized protein n=1 Tax=Salix koriyanagi TaxID=2511006 RepID=A0A9Q0UXK3_9ROSI|nr:DUF4228 domain-containing protein [Salix suchowensis]KAJ6363965.1 hypothetical protein OIU76_028991 [Salix suchowensis]KAJ6737928.1 hypothetical protein OIU74_002982 [Salix koriyanagi]
MGNCCKSAAAAAVWAGDDWSSVAHHKHRHATMFDGADDHEEHGADMERQRLLGTGSLSSGSTREVKIRVTKRELEEIMARVNLQGFSMEQVLARLVNSADLNFEMDLNHKHWKPALQSIPEVN